MVDRVDIQGVLEQMRTMRSQVSLPEQSSSNNNQFAGMVEQMRNQVSPTSDTGSVNAINSDSVSAVGSSAPVGDVPSFGEMMADAINTVNDNQQAAKELATRYELGDPKVDLPEVMIALQKSSVSFQAMTQVRNKMIDAYKDILSMTL